MHGATRDLIERLMTLPLFESEWVVWTLLGLSVITLGVALERLWFYQTHRIDVLRVRSGLEKHLRDGDYAGAAQYLRSFDALETNVVLHGLRDSANGPDAVEDLLAGALSYERKRYEARLNVLATVGSNAPFIGLFGTVLGIIRAFKDLSADMANASSAVMAGISEALVATAVGLVVAIPAVIAFNGLRGVVDGRVQDTELLARTLLAFLKGAELEPVRSK